MKFRLCKINFVMYIPDNLLFIFEKNGILLL